MPLDSEVYPVRSESGLCALRGHPVNGSRARDEPCASSEKRVEAFSAPGIRPCNPRRPCGGSKVCGSLDHGTVREPFPPREQPGSMLHLHLLQRPSTPRDRKSTRLNSSHTVISYAVF